MNPIKKGKVCSRCGINKPLSDFHKLHTGKFGRQSKCKECSSELGRSRYAKDRRGYGISPEDFANMLNEQKGVCAICFSKQSSKRSFSVDHDPWTGKIRGLLCNNCNLALGQLKEDPKIIKQALTYVERFRTKEDEEARNKYSHLPIVINNYPSGTKEIKLKLDNMIILVSMTLDSEYAFIIIERPNKKLSFKIHGSDLVDFVTAFDTFCEMIRVERVKIS